MRKACSTLALAAMTLSAGNAYATRLDPGATVVPVGTVPHPGTAILASRVTPFEGVAGTRVIRGTFISSVWESPSGLTFVYQITQGNGANTAILTSTIGQFMDQWTIFAVGAEFAEVGAGPHVASTEDARPQKYERPLNGNRIDITFTPQAIGLHSASYWMWFQTNATAWGDGFASVEDGGASAGNLSILVPIPLPTAGLMGLAGLGLIGGYRRRR
jgi:hypothetical protein